MGAARALRELGVSFAQADVLVLCYHAVRTRERFAAQMSGLARRGYSVLSMQHFIETRVAPNMGQVGLMPRPMPWEFRAAFIGS